MLSAVKSGTNSWRIIWDNVVVPVGVFNAIKSYVYKSRDYTADIRPLLAHTGDTPVDTVSNIRNQIIKMKIISNYNRQNAIVDRLVEEYATASILELARKYDFPPLSLLRNILLNSGEYSSKEIYEIFTGKAPDRLSGRDAQQFKLAAANDVLVDDGKNARVAEEAEARFVETFRELGIGLRTQAELAAEQIAEHGRAIITPDILFTDEVHINGIRVHWIDYKDYVLTSIPFLFQSATKQGNKYVAKFGPGAICYARGVVAGVAFDNPDVMILGGGGRPPPP